MNKNKTYIFEICQRLLLQRSYPEREFRNKAYRNNTIIVPTPLEGGELYTQLGFFLFRQFSPIDIFIVES